MLIAAFFRRTLFFIRVAAADVTSLARCSSVSGRIRLLLLGAFPLSLVGPLSREHASVDRLTAMSIPLVAFSLGWLWSQGARERLRYLRAAAASPRRGGATVVPLFSTALAVATGAALLLGLEGALVAALGRFPASDTLAIGRVGFAAAFAFGGLGMALGGQGPWRAFLLVFSVVILRHHREWMWAALPSTHAYALTTDPAQGLEARVRFVALLLTGLCAVLGFAWQRPAAQTAPFMGPRSRLWPSSAR